MNLINAFPHRGFLFTISFNIIRGCQSYSTLQKDVACSSIVLPNDTVVRCRGQWSSFMLFFLASQHSPLVNNYMKYCFVSRDRRDILANLVGGIVGLSPRSSYQKAWRYKTDRIVWTPGRRAEGFSSTGSTNLHLVWKTKAKETTVKDCDSVVCTNVCTLKITILHPR